MIKHTVHTPKILQIAARIEQDVRGRNLKPGDAYIGTSEVARMLGVSTVAANRAMQLLAQRRILIRRQRSGAIVAEGISSSTPPALRRVHFVVHKNYLKTEGLLADGVLIGMQKELPGVEVQLNFADPETSEATVNRLMTTTLRSNEPEGFVLIRSSLAVQRLMQASGLPTVVYGSLYPSIHGLPWIDLDHRRSGRLMTEYLLCRGCETILYLSRDVLFPGDFLFQDSVSETLAEAGYPVSSLVIRNLPADKVAIRAAVGEVLAGRDGKVGIIARTEPLSDGASSAVQAAGLDPIADVPIMISQLYRAGNENPVAFPFIRNLLAPQQIGAHLGRMLNQVSNRRSPEPDHEIIPVELANVDQRA